MDLLTDGGEDVAVGRAAGEEEDVDQQAAESHPACRRDIRYNLCTDRHHAACQSLFSVNI